MSKLRKTKQFILVRELLFLSKLTTTPFTPNIHQKSKKM